jgi:short-subunit dehydrogenase
MMRHARDAGVREHDLWGIAPERAGPDHPWYGVGLFKKGFGGRALTWAGTWDVVADPTLYRMRGMVERGRGAVLNVASLIAFQPVPFQATYGATKAFVLSYTDALHEEMRGSGVTVTAVCPGPVHTEFGEQGGFGGADERIPGALWLEADRVARDAVKALENGDRITVPGPHNQLAALWGQHLPRSVLLPLVKRLWPVS